MSQGSSSKLTSADTQQLLPPADLTSPTSKHFEMKTPPHSTQTPRSNTKNNLNRSTSATGNTKLGLLSPDFSSPNRSSNDLNNNDRDDDHDDNNQIQKSPSSSSDKENQLLFNSSFISTNSLTDVDQDITDDPLPQPKFTKKRLNDSILDSSSSNKKSKINEPPKDFELPEPDEMPEVVFNSSDKPPFSYANMIGMALLRSPCRRLTLAEIYDWIADHFSYYERGQVGWQNSIRHNLSLNKAFQKTEKSKDKKGHFWQIVPGCEYTFCNIKESKRSANSNSKKLKNANSTLNTSSSSVNDSKTSLSMVSSQNQHDPQNQMSHFSDSLLTSLTSSANEIDDSRPRTSNPPNVSLIPSTPVSRSSQQFDDSPTRIIFDFKTPVLNSLGVIPELNFHYSSFSANNHNINLLQSSPMIFDSPVANLTNSRSIDFACSFSSSNFEMSPIGAISEPGPILEPITPQRSSNQQRVLLPSISKQLQALQPLNSSNSTSTKLHPHDNRFKTPIIGSTPHGSAIKRLWASPSYLDEFLASPISNLKTHMLTSTTHPAVSLDSKLINGSPTKKLKKINGNGYSTNEIFGIDICSINNHDDDLAQLKQL